MAKIKYNEVATFEQLIDLFSSQNIQKIIIKSLSCNDNSKNQLYLGGGFEAAQIFPHSGILPDKSKSSRPEPKFKAALDFSWIDATGRVLNSPNAQLILYPKYPEVRFSGFLMGCNFDLTSLMGTDARIEGRILIWGISEQQIFGHVLSRDNPVARYIHAKYLNEENLLHEFYSLGRKQISNGIQSPIKGAQNVNENTPNAEEAEPSYPEDKPEDKPEVIDDDLQITEDFLISSKHLLLRKLNQIHNKGWIPASRLNREGTRQIYNSQNAGGYTLEAEFGITPNGYSEPDFMDWELKQYSVPSFNKIYKKPLTLMTPEPTGGYYKDPGVNDFMYKYGYKDKNGREDRINFGGVHKVGEPHSSTGLTLILAGYDHLKHKITDAFGAIQLIDNKNNIAAEWSFSSLLDHWNRKHKHAAYIPSKKRAFEGQVQFQYGNQIQLGEYTDFLLFLEAMNKHFVYYDPGIKMEQASSGTPRVKRRNQFRIGTTVLSSLYQTFETIDISGY